MTDPTTLSRLVADIAADGAGVARVLRRYRIDPCRDGGDSLEQALRRQAADNDAVLRDLEVARLRKDDPPSRPDELIAYILERFHAVHREELPELYKLARAVEATHAARPDCPNGLADFLAQMLGELEHHMVREEQVLFPTLLAGGGGCAPFALRRMRLEHTDHAERLDELAARTNGFEPPEDACGAWRALYAGCEKLSRDLRRHIEIENDILFPMFE